MAEERPVGRAAWTERDILLPRLALRLREWRSSGPALVLLHGLGVDGTVWQAIGRRLSPAYSLVAPDLRGHGRSDHPATGYHARDYAADTAELLEALAGEYGAMFLLGHSLGALAALGAAALNPSAVQRLVLEDPPLYGPGPILPYLAAVRAVQAGGPAALASVVRRFQPGLGELIVGIQAEMWARVAGAALDAVLDDPTTVFAADDWLARVEAPTLLLAADATLDGRLTPEHAIAATRRLADGHLETFPGVGHVIHAQRPAEFCRVVTEFLQR